MTTEEILARAYTRHYNLEKHGRGYNVNRSEYEEYYILEQSIRAEIFAAEYFRVEYRFLDERCGDDGYDLVLYSGAKVDIKWLGCYPNSMTPRREGYIHYPATKPMSANFYVAVSGTNDTGFKMIGWCNRKEFRQEYYTGNKRKDGSNLSYSIHTSKLHKFEEEL